MFPPPQSTNFPPSRECMSSRTITRSALIACRAIMLLLVFADVATAQADNASESAKQLTVQRIYSEPSLSGHTLRGLAWTPDGKQISFLAAKRFTAEESVENERHGKQRKENSAALWKVDATSGERRMLLSGERLASMLPENSSAPSQATGLGRHAPREYQWAPDGTALLFQGSNALVWFALKSQEPRTLVSGNATLADPKISPDGKFISFVRDHNLWLVTIADGKERAITRDGVEEIRKGELDWVYAEE